MQGFQSFAEAFRGIVCHVSFALLAILIFAPAIAWLAKTLAIPVRRVLGGGIVRVVLAVAMVGTGIVESFSKHTNGVPLRRTGDSPPYQVTDGDVSNGWRVVATREGREMVGRDVLIAPHIHEPWLLRGGFEDFMRIPFGGWLFPWRGEFADGLTVFSDGKIRPALRTPYFPRPFDVPLAVVPAFNWYQLPGGVSNVFWHAATPSNSLVVAFENALVNYDVNCLTNFQAEFFADGRFAYRYDDRVVDYAPVFPFDWDNDGMENSVDPDPLVAGPDAHGTNAEWYNVVCSNIVNSNAYYFVDVVAERGPAPIYFTGDRESRLGNPVVVARGGETNRVPLLMGVEYSVTSSVPFMVHVPDNAEVSGAGASGGRTCAVKWSLSFGFSVASGGGYEVEVHPFDPGGEFTWSAAWGGLNLRSGSGCSYTSVSNWIGFTCGAGGNCGCNGCSLEGTYCIEGASFSLPSLWCGCSTAGHGSTNEPPSTPCVSVSFDKSVVFYEDAYTNAPNDVVAKRSTNTTLTVSAYGGEAGGMLYVSEQNIGKLVRVGGKAISFPYAAFVPPQSGVSFSIEYEAETHSDFQNDISVSASILPGDGGMPCTASASVTAAEILIEAEASFPTNKHRHVFGPAEWVKYAFNPPMPSATLQGTVPSNGMHDHLQGRLFMPFGASHFTMTMVDDGASFSLPFVVIEPVANLFVDGVGMPSADDWTHVMNVPPLQEGDIGAVFHVDMSLKPSHVSFAALGVMELYAAATDIQGFFTNAVFNGHLDHDTDAGAFRPLSVNADNTVGTGDNIFFALNNAFLPYLRYGTFKLEIPVVWYVRNESVTNRLVVLEARNTVYANADVTVSKYSISVTRGTNDVFTISR